MKGARRPDTTFEIRLPLIDETLAFVQPVSNAAGPARRILVVDDNGDAAEMLAGLLKFDGHDVDTALSGLEALERIAAFKPDIALLDIGLPGLDGYEVARRVRADAANGRVQLIAITGYGRDEDRERARAAGFAAHLVKPVELVVLRRVLAELPVLA